MIYVTTKDQVVHLNEDGGPVLVLDEDGEWRIDVKGEQGEKNVMNLPGVLAGRFYLVPVPGTLEVDVDWVTGQEQH